MAIFHCCGVCSKEIDGEYCAEHPDAEILSIYAPVEGIDTPVYSLCCDRCGDTAASDPTNLVNEAYLTDDPYAATGNLCPACATDDDPHHLPGSWLLIWG